MNNHSSEPPAPTPSDDSSEEETQSLSQENESPKVLVSLAGNVIGPYKLLQKLGEGGMGEVWMAGQKKTVKRRVALNVVKLPEKSLDQAKRLELLLATPLR